MESTQTDLTPPTPPQPGSVVVPGAILSKSPNIPAIPTALLENEVAPGVIEPTPVAKAEPTDDDQQELVPEDLDGSEKANDEELFESNEPAFQWQASEYVQHHKGPGWYFGLGAVVLVLLGVAILTHQWLSIAVFLVMAIAVVVYAHKPPRILTYMLDSTGITIEDKFYPYDQFRSFAVLQDSEWHAIDLEPTQRFMPRLTVIFVSEDLDGIVEHLSFHLPRTDRQPDLIERLTRYVRF